MLKYSILDLATVGEGISTKKTFENVRNLAQHAEEWGYHRFWLAEHHNMKSIASSATSVLIGYLAEGTKTLRIGSISGSGFTFIDSIGKNTQAAKDYIKVKLGWNDEQASRIVDMTQASGPKSIEELKTQLLVIASRPDSKKLVLDDLKEAMTGYGT
jgi:hypothetical protein